MVKKVNNKPLLGTFMDTFCPHRMLRKGALSALGCCLLLGLSGCASLLQKEPQPVAEPTADAVLLEKIDQHARSASIALGRLADVERASRPATQPASSTVPPGMEVITNVSWNGPLETLVNRMAMVSGYTVLPPVGRKPPTPVIVAIHVTNATVFDVLRDAGAQAGAQVNLVVRPDERTFELRYGDVSQANR